MHRHGLVDPGMLPQPAGDVLADCRYLADVLVPQADAGGVPSRCLQQLLSTPQHMSGWNRLDNASSILEVRQWVELLQ